VGWGWVEAISRHHDLWVITRQRFQGEIEEELETHSDLSERAMFYYIPWRRCQSLERVWPPLRFWSYKQWQKSAHRLGARLHTDVGFDVVHQLTWVCFRQPGYLWKLNIPFVWGPIGGLENTPWRILRLPGLRGAAYYASRNIVNWLHKRFLPGPRRAFRKASGGIIAATEGIRREIKRFYAQDSEVICEVGPPRRIAATHSVRQNGEPLRIAWSGLHVPGKALPLLLCAVASLAEGVNWQLDIFGEGPCSAKWQRLARKLEVGERCTWHGWLPRDKAVSLIHHAHVFVLTSIKELSSTVLVEALSQGVPVVCLSHCGFPDLIMRQCGIKIPLESASKIVRQLAAAIRTLWEDERYRQELAAGAIALARELTFGKKAEAVCRIYERVTGPQSGMSDKALWRTYRSRV